MKQSTCITRGPAGENKMNKLLYALIAYYIVYAVYAIIYMIGVTLDNCYRNTHTPTK